MQPKISLKSAQNIFNDAQNITSENLKLEQTYNQTIQSGIMQNNIGTGVLLESIVQNILWNSDLYSFNIFRVGINASLQPSDIILGNQLEITLNDTQVGGNRTIRIAIFGKDLNDDLIVEYFYFKNNESQISKRHFVNISAIIIDDWKYDQILVGSVVIKEAKPLTVSRDSIVFSQNVEPSGFWRDFYPNSGTITSLLDSLLGIGTWNSLFSLNVNDNIINSGDFHTEIGEKFLATVDNIKKIRVLLKYGSIVNNLVSNNLTLTLYPLQTTISNPLSKIPNSQIEYDASIISIAQISQDVLLDNDYKPIDFYLQGAKLVVGNYYVFTIKNSTPNNIQSLYIAGSSTKKWIENARQSTFSIYGQSNDGIWTDNTNSDLWFEIYSDSLKISDGKYYTNGISTSIDKSFENTDYCYDSIVSDYLSNTTPCSIVAGTTIKKSIIKTDQRTGQNIYTAKENDSNVYITNTTTFTDLVIAKVQDYNRKIPQLQIFSGSNQNIILFDQNNIYIINSSNDTNSIINGGIGSSITILVPTLNAKTYIIDNVEIIYSVLGDINQDGIVDKLDLNAYDNMALSISYHNGNCNWKQTGQLTPYTGLNTLGLPDQTSNLQDMLTMILADVNYNREISATNNNRTILSNYIYHQTITGNIGSQITILKITVSDRSTVIDPATNTIGLDLRDDNVGKNVNANMHSPPNITFPTSTLLLNTTLTISSNIIWDPYYIIVSNLNKYIPTIFDSNVNLTNIDYNSTKYSKNNLVNKTNNNYNKIDCFVPNDLIISGDIVNIENNPYKVDFETSTITLYLNGDSPNQGIVYIDVLNSLIAETNPGTGLTDRKYKALKFSDGTYVKSDAVLNDQLRFSISIESYTPHVNTTSGVSVIQSQYPSQLNSSFDSKSGILRIHFLNLQNGLQPNDTYEVLISKIIITVYIKKAGFNNQPLILDSLQTTNLLNSEQNNIIPITNTPAYSYKQIDTIDISTVAGGNYTIQGFEQVIQVINANSTHRTIDLSGVLNKGREIVINNPHSSIYPLYILPGMSKTINGFYDNSVNVFTLPTNQSIIVVYDGVNNWEISANFRSVDNNNINWGYDLISSNDNLGQNVVGITGVSLGTLSATTNNNSVNISAKNLTSTNDAGLSLSTLEKSISINVGTTISTTTGGNVNITSGIGNATGGSVNITGSSGGTTGGNVNITAGSSGGITGGNVNITSGGCGNASGNVIITTYNSSNITGDNNILTGDGNVAGSIFIKTGIANNQSGNIEISVQDCHNGNGGNLSLQAGAGTIGGNVNIKSGVSNNVSGNIIVCSSNNISDNNNPTQTGSIDIYSGIITNSSSSGSTSGIVKFYSGNADSNNASGDIKVYSGSGGSSGKLNLYTGNASSQSGKITINTGTCVADNSGEIDIYTGDSYNSGTLKLYTGDGYASGSINMYTGNNANTSGSILITTGNANSTGTLSLSTGYASVGNSGDIYISTGGASGSSGSIIFNINYNDPIRVMSIVPVGKVEFSGGIRQNVNYIILPVGSTTIVPINITNVNHTIFIDNQTTGQSFAQVTLPANPVIGDSYKIYARGSGFQWTSFNGNIALSFYDNIIINDSNNLAQSGLYDIIFAKKDNTNCWIITKYVLEMAGITL